MSAPRGLEMAEKVAKAILYEGYLLYPYYTSSTKNQQRWTFGCLYPRTYVEHAKAHDSFDLQTECLVECEDEAKVTVRVRFLQLVGEGAMEREVVLPELVLGQLLRETQENWFGFPPCSESPALVSGCVEGRFSIRAERIEGSLCRLSLRIENGSLRHLLTRDEALLHSMVSTHCLLSIDSGSFVSLMDPPENIRVHAQACQNRGAWPVLIGEVGERRMMLSSPIILYDYPQIAPESPGDLFDGTEIDEILSLRILTLTDQEKEWIRSADEVGRALLERTENLPEDRLLQMHGVLREVGDVAEEPSVALDELNRRTVRLEDMGFKPGDRVRIHPKNPRDIFDIELAGKSARIESLEEDFEGEIHLAVTFDDDPGRDLGAAGQPGHRFFFKPDEVVPYDA